MQLTQQIALVTGATRGIGRAIALRLAAEGATVIGTATSDAGAQTISATLSQAGSKGEGRVLDVCDAAACSALIKDITASHGSISILVNNAGITRDNLMLRMKEAEWQSIIDTNLTAVFRLSQAVLKGMLKARGGRIINISSVVGLTGNPGQANYAAAKAGLIGFTKSLAREVGSRSITVNAIAPGFIATDMTEALGEDVRQALLQQIPLQQLGKPEDIAAAVAFLASAEAAYITGETLNVNGGMFMP